jgi:hypothetical protein
MDIDYTQKYLKYKEKYNSLFNLVGSGGQAAISHKNKNSLVIYDVPTPSTIINLKAYLEIFLDDDPKIVNLTSPKLGNGKYFTFVDFNNNSLAKKAMGKINSVKNVWADFNNDNNYLDPSFKASKLALVLEEASKPASKVSSVVAPVVASKITTPEPAIPATLAPAPPPKKDSLYVSPASSASVASSVSQASVALPPLPPSPVLPSFKSVVVKGSVPDKAPEEIIVETDKLFKVKGKAEMLNYWYVWFNFDASKNEIIDIPEKKEQQTLDTINFNAFPINHIYKDDYHFTTKKKVLEDEYSFLKGILKAHNINLIQIPRIIYDLVSYDYLVDKELMYKPQFKLDDEKTYNELRKKIKAELMRPIFVTTVKEINKLFYTEYFEKDMIPILLDESANHFPVFLRILDKILLKTTQRYTGNIRILTDTTMNKGVILTHPRFSIMIKQLLYVECGYIYNFNGASSYYTANTEKNKFLLFRGENRLDDSTIRTGVTKVNNKFPVHSLSFNTSLISGIFHEVTCSSKGACTYQFYSKDHNKKYYLLDKFMLDDCSIYDKLFHIPPLHPIFCLLGLGEIWHPRTRITIDYKLNPYSSTYPVSGLFMYDVATILISKIETQEEFAKEYQNIIGPTPGQGRRKILINRSFIKYLYYKSKYLELKNKLTLHN